MVSSGDTLAISDRTLVASSVLLVIATSVIMLRALWLTARDVEHDLRMESETENSGAGSDTSRYKKGDYIVLKSDGTSYVMGRENFTSRYELSSSEVSDVNLSADGFQIFQPTGKIWARKLLSDEIKTNFPAGMFVAGWGSNVNVKAGDYLAMPFPAGGEIYCIASDELAVTYKELELNSVAAVVGSGIFHGGVWIEGAVPSQGAFFWCALHCVSQVW